MIRQIISGILRIVTAVVILIMILGIPTMLLWNWLMPSIFGLRQITFFEAFGLIALCGCLFGSKSINFSTEQKY